MKIKVTVSKDDEDALLPYLASTDFLNIECRAESAAAAFSSARGVALCAMGQLEHPPRRVEFYVVLSRRET